MFLKNIRYALLDGKWKENVSISIVDGKVHYGHDKSDRVVECSEYILLPGFTNAHTHAAMTLFRGYEDNLPLKDWLEKKIWPIEANLKPEHVYAGSLIACIEMLSYGIVHFNDMYFFEENTARAVKQIGMKANLAEAIIDFIPNSLNKAKSLLKKTTKDIHYSLGPHAVYSCSAETLLAVKEIAQKYACAVHIHVSETKQELEDCLKQKGNTPTKYLNSLGLLSNRTIAAHCCWLNETDIKLLNENGVLVAHCPSSNLKLATGFAHIERLQNVKLGTDGVASNNCFNMFTEAKLAALLLRSRGCIFPSERILDIAAFHTIQEGCNADLVLINTKSVQLLPLSTSRLSSHLIYSFTGPVNHVIINGEPVLWDSKPVKVSFEYAVEKFEKARKELFKDTA